MKQNQQYCDWKKELQIWKATNTSLRVNEKIQAGILLSSNREHNKLNTKLLKGTSLHIEISNATGPH